MKKGEVRNLPMGFETVQGDKISVSVLKFETSLWDLKLFSSTSSISLSILFETSLWDLKLLYC